MAVYFVSGAGSNTAPYDTWAKAATSLATALSSATSNGDQIIIDCANVPSTDSAISTAKTYTAAAHISIISSTNSGTSTVTPTAMGTSDGAGTFIGNNSSSYDITMAGAYKVYVYGVTFRFGGSSTVAFQSNSANGSQYIYDNCHVRLNTGQYSRIRMGTTDGYSIQATVFVNSTFRYGDATQRTQSAGLVVLDNLSISSSGTAPTVLFHQSADGAHSAIHMHGCDLSHITTTLVGDNTGVGKREYYVSQSKIGSGTILASQSKASLSACQVFLFDCDIGDVHTTIGYYNPFGSAVSEYSIYYTSGAAAQSWKIVTSAAASYYSPFVTPWIDFYHTGTSAITPYFEILRDGSVSAYNNDDVWAEFTAKTTSGSTKASAISSDWKGIDSAVANATQAAGAGTGAWTGEAASAWSGKCDSGSSLTPAESGCIRGRLCFAKASSTVYLDPQIRT